VSTLPPGAKDDWADALAKILRLEHDVRLAFRSLGVDFPLPAEALPPMRPEERSSHNWAVLADKVADAAKEGTRREDTTPEAMVRKVIADEAARRAELHDLARLRKVDEDALQARIERRKMMRSVVKAALSGVAAFLSLELVKYVLTLHSVP
jgi:hypothetical protein